MNNKIILLMGRSGSGKTTIANELEQIYGLKSISSYTTRPMRYPNEIGHIFLFQDEFENIRNNLVAYTKFNGYEYGVTKEQIENNNVYVIDPKGAECLKKRYSGSKQLVVIGLKVSPTVALYRMLKRKDGMRKCYSRFMSDMKEFKNMEFQCDYVVNNKNITKTTDKIFKKVFTS